MKKFRVTLNRTTMDNAQIEIVADNAITASDKAIDDFIGEHDWHNQETIEISVSECEEIE